MKKLIYLVALLGVAAGSFAFLPKAEEPVKYMMVSGRFFGFKSSELVVASADEQTITEVATVGGATKGQAAIHQAEMIKLGQLRASGWVVTQMSQSTFSPGYNVLTNYLLEKR